jgi:hypothetical protein
VSVPKRLLFQQQLRWRTCPSSTAFPFPLRLLPQLELYTIFARVALNTIFATFAGGSKAASDVMVASLPWLGLLRRGRLDDRWLTGQGDAPADARRTPGVGTGKSIKTQLFQWHLEGRAEPDGMAARLDRLLDRGGRHGRQDLQVVVAAGRPREVAVLMERLVGSPAAWRRLRLFSTGPGYRPWGPFNRGQFSSSLISLATARQTGHAATAPSAATSVSQMFIWVSVSNQRVTSSVLICRVRSFGENWLGREQTGSLAITGSRKLWPTRLRLQAFS